MPSLSIIKWELELNIMNHCISCPIITSLHECHLTSLINLLSWDVDLPPFGSLWGLTVNAPWRVKSWVIPRIAVFARSFEFGLEIHEGSLWFRLELLRFPVVLSWQSPKVKSAMHPWTWAMLSISDHPKCISVNWRVDLKCPLWPCVVSSSLSSGVPLSFVVSVPILSIIIGKLELYGIDEPIPSSIVSSLHQGHHGNFEERIAWHVNFPPLCYIGLSIAVVDTGPRVKSWLVPVCIPHALSLEGCSKIHHGFLWKIRELLFWCNSFWKINFLILIISIPFHLKHNFSPGQCLILDAITLAESQLLISEPKPLCQLVAVA